MSQSNYTLETLDIGTNGCGSDAADAICMVRSCSPAAALLSCIVQMLSNNSDITDISLANNKLEDEDLGKILESVKEMKAVTSLDISHNSGNRQTGAHCFMSAWRVS